MENEKKQYLYEFFAYEEIGYPKDSYVGLQVLEAYRKAVIGKPLLDETGVKIGDIVGAKIEGTKIKCTAKVDNELIDNIEYKTDGLSFSWKYEK